MHAAVYNRKDVSAALFVNQVGARGSRDPSPKEQNMERNAFAACGGKYAVAWQGGATAERVEDSDVIQRGGPGFDG